MNTKKYPAIKELKLTYRRKRVKDDLLKKSVSSPAHVFKLFKEMQNETREKVVCLHLNPQLEILSYEVVSIGTAHKTFCEPLEILRGVIITYASSFIIVHNHPNGNYSPSQADLDTASKIAEVGELLKLPLHDFIIIGDNGFYSFREKNKL